MANETGFRHKDFDGWINLDIPAIAEAWEAYVAVARDVAGGGRFGPGWRAQRDAAHARLQALLQRNPEDLRGAMSFDYF